MLLVNLDKLVDEAKKSRKLFKKRFRLYDNYDDMKMMEHWDRVAEWLESKYE